jgi:hypothetical protein
MSIRNNLPEHCPGKRPSPVPPRRKERIFAWALLLLLCVQRILGLVSNELVYSIEVMSDMNDVESLIAERLERETGTDVEVRVRDREEVESLQILGYSAPFVFSEEVDGDLWYYTIENKLPQLIEYTYKETRSSAPANLPDSNRLSKEEVLTKFFCWESVFTVHHPTTVNISGSTVPQLLDDPFLSIPSPPPRPA